MPGVARAGVDAAGGIITGGGQDFVFIDGAPEAVVGDAVANHGKGPHRAAVMAAGSPFDYIDGIPVCRAGDAATCGHVATGSGWVFSQ